MSDAQFDAFLAAALDELDEKQQRLEHEHGLGRWSRFVVDYPAASLQFFERESLRADAVIVPVGTHVPASDSFQWGWANPQFPADIRVAAGRVKALREHTGMDVFGQERISCTDAMAWEVTAMACKFLGALGAYRIPHGSLQSYVLITAMRGPGVAPTGPAPA